MFFAATSPAFRSRSAYAHPTRALEQFLARTAAAPRAQAWRVEQDATSYTLALDVPGIAREQLTIGIEGNVVRIDSKADAPRSYHAAYELPTDLDVASSQARLEHGVLTLKLAKLVPASKVTELVIN
ncbi:MAG: Hsp20/alpha crystallin family protein [Rhodoferax sp.]